LHIEAIGGTLDLRVTPKPPDAGPVISTGRPSPLGRIPSDGEDDGLKGAEFALVDVRQYMSMRVDRW